MEQILLLSRLACELASRVPRSFLIQVAKSLATNNGESGIAMHLDSIPGHSHRLAVDEFLRAWKQQAAGIAASQVAAMLVAAADATERSNQAELAGR